MLLLLLVLALIWVACIILGILLKAVAWLAIVGLVALVVTALFGITRAVRA